MKKTIALGIVDDVRTEDLRRRWVVQAKVLCQPQVVKLIEAIDVIHGGEPNVRARTLGRQSRWAKIDAP